MLVSFFLVSEFKGKVKKILSIKSQGTRVSAEKLLQRYLGQCLNVVYRNDFVILLCRSVTSEYTVFHACLPGDSVSFLLCPPCEANSDCKPVWKT